MVTSSSSSEEIRHAPHPFGYDVKGQATTRLTEASGIKPPCFAFQANPSPLPPFLCPPLLPRNRQLKRGKQKLKEDGRLRFSFSSDHQHLFVFMPLFIYVARIGNARRYTHPHLRSSFEFWPTCAEGSPFREHRDRQHHCQFYWSDGIILSHIFFLSLLSLDSKYRRN